MDSYIQGQITKRKSKAVTLQNSDYLLASLNSISNEISQGINYSKDVVNQTQSARFENLMGSSINHSIKLEKEINRYNKLSMLTKNLKEKIISLEGQKMMSVDELNKKLGNSEKEHQKIQLRNDKLQARIIDLNNQVKQFRQERAVYSNIFRQIESGISKRKSTYQQILCQSINYNDQFDKGQKDFRLYQKKVENIQDRNNMEQKYAIQQLYDKYIQLINGQKEYEEQTIQLNKDSSKQQDEDTERFYELLQEQKYYEKQKKQIQKVLKLTMSQDTNEMVKKYKTVKKDINDLFKEIQNKTNVVDELNMQISEYQKKIHKLKQQQITVDEDDSKIQQEKMKTQYIQKVQGYNALEKQLLKKEQTLDTYFGSLQQVFETIGQKVEFEDYNYKNHIEELENQIQNELLLKCYYENNQNFDQYKKENQTSRNKEQLLSFMLGEAHKDGRNIDKLYTRGEFESSYNYYYNQNITKKSVKNNK